MDMILTVDLYINYPRISKIYSVGVYILNTYNIINKSVLKVFRTLYISIEYIQMKACRQTLRYLRLTVKFIVSLIVSRSDNYDNVR